MNLGLQGKSKSRFFPGLTEGERVIVGNRNEFRNGEKVTPQEIKLPQLQMEEAS